MKLRNKVVTANYNSNNAIPDSSQFDENNNKPSSIKNELNNNKKADVSIEKLDLSDEGRIANIKKKKEEVDSHYYDLNDEKP